MHLVKASDLVGLRKHLADERPEVLDQVRARLSPELRAVLDKAVASTWLADPEICELYEHFAKTLFPGSLSAHTQLGHMMALNSYRGVYRVFLAIPSTTFVMKKSASVWASYHSTGKASMEDVQERSAVLVVRGADPICKVMVDIITGHILALAELTQAKSPLVAANVSNSSELRWSIRWK
ncbi:MAG: hypothetical protein U0271_13695 [Polyangiaceae bacterium]